MENRFGKDTDHMTNLRYYNLRSKDTTIDAIMESLYKYFMAELKSLLDGVLKQAVGERSGIA